jgi:hypothetical protein
MNLYDPQTKKEIAIIGSVIVILIANILNLILN